MVFGQLVMAVQCFAVLRQCCAEAQAWPNAIQCLGLDDIMPLGIKPSAFLRVRALSCEDLDSRHMVFSIWYEMGPYGLR